MKTIKKNIFLYLSEEERKSNLIPKLSVLNFKKIKAKRRLDPIYNFSNPKERETYNPHLDSEKFDIAPENTHYWKGKA